LTPLRDFLHALHVNGAQIRVEGDRLVLDAPSGVLAPEVLDLVRYYKPEILAEVGWIQAATVELDGSSTITMKGDPK
jgi:hypothetical protein